jgi:hypothetical protein
MMERRMKSKVTILLLLMSAFAIGATATVAEPLPAHKHHRHPAHFGDRAVAFEEQPGGWYENPRWYEQPGWYERWQQNRLYGQRNGYWPDYRGCFPGACRDNPRY